MKNSKRKKMTSISLDDASEGMDYGYTAIKNFIISDGKVGNSVFSLEYPTLIEGIAFVLCTQGRCRVKLNMIEYETEEKTLLTILPGSICESISISDNYLCEFLFFSIEFMYGLNIPNDIDLLERIGDYPCIQLTEEQFGSLLNFHSFMVEQYKRENHLYREILAKNLLASFFTEVASIYIESEIGRMTFKGRREEIYHQFGKLLLKNIKTERSVQFYADRMCLSAKYLSQLIKEISGRPVMEWISELTIVIIKAMLKTSTLTVLQISEELNFPNSSFFGRYFKKHTGMTPIQYRGS